MLHNVIKGLHMVRLSIRGDWRETVHEKEQKDSLIVRIGQKERTFRSRKSAKKYMRKMTLLLNYSIKTRVQHFKIFNFVFCSECIYFDCTVFK